MLIEPFYQDDLITLYCGDAREIVPALDFKADAIIADPPYMETSLKWDRWPDGWPESLLSAAPSMWCFGSLRMFMNRASEFAGWKMSHDVVWEKHNGSNAFNDRFRRIHESVAHFYSADKRWTDIYKCPQYTNDAAARTVRRKYKPGHWSELKESFYKSEDGGPRMMTSVLYARSCHSNAFNPTQKPDSIIMPLALYAVPPRGKLLVPFAGSGADLLCAKKLGIQVVAVEIREDACETIVRRLLQENLPFKSFTGAIER